MIKYSSIPIANPHDHIFWGKYQSQGPRSLSLASHCLDVGLTFRSLIELPGFQRTLQAYANRQLTQRDFDRLAVLATLHDVGKACLGFQFKVFFPQAAKGGHIRELEAVFADQKLLERFIEALRWDLLVAWFPSETVAESFLLAIWSHHGSPIRFEGKTTGTFFLAKNNWWQPQETWDPMLAVADIREWAAIAFPSAFDAECLPLPETPAFQHRFAGLVMLADWIGSHPEWFPIEKTDCALRIQQNRERLPHLLKSLGLEVSAPRLSLALQPGDFHSRFGFYPRPLQALFDALDPKVDNTRLLIAESETGSGKTEAALHWFSRLFAAGKADSLYFALPTRVAARELYTRINHYIGRFFPDALVRPMTLLAVPGYQQVDGISAARVLPPAETRWTDEKDLARQERHWAAEHPKRFLAATVAVGTVDQALLSMLQVAHAHMRSVCLDRSLLVIDEVHASDAYMARLLTFLLKHHLSVGGYALLLSATLGSCARRLFLSSSGFNRPQMTIEDAAALPYPSLTFCDGETNATPCKTSHPKTISFQTTPFAETPQTVIPILLQALTVGARILMILNTVNRVNSLLKVIENDSSIMTEWLFACNKTICPHHGRFAPADRLRLDKAISERLGPATPPGPVLAVGTQTLEQSLDIDADLMITDLCPADVLLQRVGRLHRHDRRRPKGLEKASCIVLVPTQEDLESMLTDAGDVQASAKTLGYGSVYADVRVLQLTLHSLRLRPVINIPEDNRWLVEQTTHPYALASLTTDKWQKHAQLLQGGAIMSELAAANAAAVYDQCFGEFVFNEAGGKVATRLGADSLLLPLERTVMSPFGAAIEHMVIPGHMRPDNPEDYIAVRAQNADKIYLQCGKRSYCYSRYGLEEVQA